MLCGDHLPPGKYRNLKPRAPHVHDGGPFLYHGAKHILHGDRFVTDKPVFRIAEHSHTDSRADPDLVQNKPRIIRIAQHRGRTGFIMFHPVFSYDPRKFRERVAERLDQLIADTPLGIGVLPQLNPCADIIHPAYLFRGKFKNF